MAKAKATSNTFSSKPKSGTSRHTKFTNKHVSKKAYKGQGK